MLRILSPPGWWPSSALTQQKNGPIEFSHPSYPLLPKQKIIWRVSLFSKQMTSTPKKPFSQKGFQDILIKLNLLQVWSPGSRRKRRCCQVPHGHPHDCALGSWAFSQAQLGAVRCAWALLSAQLRAEERTEFLPVGLTGPALQVLHSQRQNKKSAPQNSRPGTLETLACSGKRPDG